MDKYYLIRYEQSWIWKKFWVTFENRGINLFDNKKDKFLTIPYGDIHHVIKIPFSIDQIRVFCEKDVLENYPEKDVKWFPPRPLISKKVFEFSIFSLKRKEIIKKFEEHGVKTSTTPMELKKYWEKIVKQQFEHKS